MNCCKPRTAYAVLKKCHRSSQLLWFSPIKCVCVGNAVRERFLSSCGCGSSAKRGGVGGLRCWQGWAQAASAITDHLLPWQSAAQQTASQGRGPVRHQRCAGGETQGHEREGAGGTGRAGCPRGQRGQRGPTALPERPSPWPREGVLS